MSLVQQLIQNARKTDREYLLAQLTTLIVKKIEKNVKKETHNTIIYITAARKMQKKNMQVYAARVLDCAISRSNMFVLI